MRIASAFVVVLVLGISPGQERKESPAKPGGGVGVGRPAPSAGLRDRDPQVRLTAALALVEPLDEEAISVLIDLLAELPPPQPQLAEQALQQVAEE